MGSNPTPFIMKTVESIIADIRSVLDGVPPEDSQKIAMLFAQELGFDEDTDNDGQILFYTGMMEDEEGCFVEFDPEVDD